MVKFLLASITIGGAGTGNPAELLNAVISEN